MSPQPKSENGSDPGLPPGADRFWGQFSAAKGGRTTTDEEPQAGPKADENGDAGTAHAENGGGHECLEWCPICRSAELLKAAGVASPEIRQQIHAFQNEAINILKAFAATYAERTADHQGEPGPNQNDGNGNGHRPGPESDEPKVTDISIE